MAPKKINYGCFLGRTDMLNESTTSQNMCKRSLTSVLFTSALLLVFYWALRYSTLTSSTALHSRQKCVLLYPHRVCMCILADTRCKDPLAKTSYSAASEQTLCRVERTFFSFSFFKQSVTLLKKGPHPIFI